MNKKAIIITVIIVAVIAIAAYLLLTKHKIKADNGQCYTLNGDQVDCSTGTVIKTHAQILAGK